MIKIGIMASPHRAHGFRAACRIPKDIEVVGIRIFSSPIPPYMPYDSGMAFKGEVSVKARI